MRNITLCVLLMLMSAATPVFARFSRFVCITPDNPDPQSKIQPVITFTSSMRDCVAVTVPVLDGSRKYWLIVSSEPLSPEKQNFRDMVQVIRVLCGNVKPSANRREDVVLIAPLAANGHVLAEADGATNGTSITIQMSLELAERAYIYVDYPYMVMDGGYFWAVDIPSFVKRLKMKPNQASQSIGAGAPQTER